MDFFEEEANSFDENQCEDIETLRKMYDHYNGIFNFKCEREIKTNITSIWTKYLDIVQISRSICLMNLAQSDDFQFFDCPSLEEMFKCAFMQPLRIIFHFKQTVSQSLMNLVQIIHQNHKQFAGKVIEYFKDDLSLHTLFSLSTFPALYGFFNTQDMCKQGFDFLSDFLNLTSQEHVFEAMLTSYFDCAFPFWTNFVEIFVQSLFNTEVEETFITEAIMQSTLKSSCHLTPYHIKIIKIFNEFSETRCLQFLSSIFKSNFHRYTARQYIPTQIQAIVDDAFARSPIVLYHALINVSYHTKSIPDAIPSQVLYKIPLILSDRDVVVLLEILRDDKLQRPLQQLVDNANSLFRNGYCPFTFDLHSPMYFFKQPSAKTNDPSLVSAYAKYRQNCISNSHNPIKFLSNSNVSDEFIKYALRFEICNLKINMDSLSNNISILEQQIIFENYRQILLNAQKDSIAIHTSLILNQKSFVTKQKVEINQIFKDISGFAKIINFEEHPYSLCLRPAISVAFSKYNLEMSHIFNKISNKMTELIKKFRKDSDFIAVRPPQRLISIANHLLKTVEIEKTKSKASYGQILDMLFYYIEALQASDPNGTFEKLLFWRSFLPDDSKSEEARMILMTRLFIGFFIFREVLEDRFFEYNLEDMLHKYMRIENCIMYPFVGDKDLMTDIIDKLLHSF